MSDAVASSLHGDRGISVPRIQPSYQTYRSPHAPKYTVARNFHGVDAVKARRIGITLGMFGGVAGVALLFFASDIPRVRIDIMQKLPLIGDYFVKEVPPEDNPF